jgi:hypothetical protein
MRKRKFSSLNCFDLNELCLLAKRKGLKRWKLNCTLNWDDFFAAFNRFFQVFAHFLKIPIYFNDSFVLFLFPPKDFASLCEKITLKVKFSHHRRDKSLNREGETSRRAFSNDKDAGKWKCKSR